MGNISTSVKLTLCSCSIIIVGYLACILVIPALLTKNAQHKIDNDNNPRLPSSAYEPANQPIPSPVPSPSPS